MRWLFLLLLVLNLFYYIWHKQQTPLPVKGVAPIALYKDDPRGVHLLDEHDRARVRPAGDGERCSSAP